MVIGQHHITKLINAQKHRYHAYLTINPKGLALLKMNLRSLASEHIHFINVDKTPICVKT